MRKKRFICLLLALVMCLSLMPITAMADGTAEAATQDVTSRYIEDFTFDRGKDSRQLYLRSDSLNEELTYDEFKFDPEITDYDIMLVDSGIGNDNSLCVRVTPNSEEEGFSGKFTNGYDGYPLTKKAEKNYTDTRQDTLGAVIFGVGTTAEHPTMDSKALKRSFVAGIKDDNGEYTETETYTFNFYRKATLASFAVAYTDGGDPISVIPAKFDPYETNLAVENVKAGTTELRITAPAYTQNDTALKFDGGVGTYILGENDTTFTLDLTKYTPDKDGSITVPFMLDYTGSGSGVDGHYTLKISFAEEEVDYTPVFTNVSEDAKVKVGDEVSLLVEVEDLDSDTASSLSYQWYSSDSDTSEGDPIPGATETAYKAATTSTGITYYTCEATRTVEGAEYSANTESIKVTVEEDLPGDIYTPVFTNVSEDAKVKVGDEVSLLVEVEDLDSDTASSLSYQWYSSDLDTSEGDPIPGATETAYKAATTSTGITYYTCEVTRTVKGAEYSANIEPIKVTVEEDSTRDINGFVKNITFKTSTDSYIVFDTFKQNETSYDINGIPMMSSGGSNRFAKDFDILVELTDPDPDSIGRLNYSLSVESPDGEELRFAKPPRGGFYNKATIDVTDSFWMVDDRGAVVYILDYLEIGEYVFKINVHERGNPESGDVYTFHITFVPVVTGLSGTSGGKNLSITPQFSNEIYPDPKSFFNRDFEMTSAGETEITLKGTMQPAGARFIYKDEDKTEDFTNVGVTIDLTDYEPEDGVYAIPFSIAHDAGENTHSEYTLRITAGEAVGWTITGQPQGGTYDKGDRVVLSVETDADDGDVTYQWQYSSSNPNAESDFNDIPGAIEPSFEAPTEIGGTRYYRCVVTDKNTKVYVNSDIAQVIVNLGKVNAPVIVHQPGIYNITGSHNLTPYKTEYLQGEAIDPIQTSVGTSEGTGRTGLAKVEVEWYYNTQKSTQGAVLLNNSNYGKGISYNVLNIDNVGNRISTDVYNYIPPEPLEVGEHYFYCVATAISNADETNTTSVISDFVKITVSERTELAGFEGKGTEDDPYLIKTVENFEKIREYVLGGDFLAGAVFKFDNDITLPADWEPIGKGGTHKGKDLLAFSGIIDGDNKTLTVEKGGKPLLNFTRDAVVKNLKIYGEEINGAGLLDRVIIDYGTDGVYQQFTDPDVITLENVTLLSGSKTLGSGLVNGGRNSGINDTFVKNCTIEEGVVVGYNKDQKNIGSFVGTFNGRVENSVSYATVYGVRNVGGLVGLKAQSMGDCEIVNSAFLGEMVATGGHVGGIIGSGYISDSAPNTPPITVRNCYVAADITGNSTPDFEPNGYDNGGGIGGIAGSEIGLRAAWNNSYISDNHFYGTITDMNPDAETRYDRVGGILGEVGSYDPKTLFYENNYYVKNNDYEGLGYQLRPNKDWSPNEDSFIAKTAGEFADGTVTDLLNSGKYSFKNWIQEDTSYPVHDSNAKPRIYALKISGEFKDIYYVGEELDTTGMKLTVLYTITGDEVKVNLKDAAFSGYNPDITGSQEVTVTYGGVSETFTVSVIRRYVEGDPKNDTISVKFALIGSTKSDGDIDLGDEDLLYRGASYETWIRMTNYKMAKGATVLELFDRALNEADIPYTIKSMNNYVDSIKGLSEFTNGPRSGWMYTVGKKDDGSDGSHPDLGLREYVLRDGDVVIWHYVNDYSYEVRDWFDESGYPSLGNGTYYNLWLKALASGRYTPPSGSGDSTNSSTVLTPKVTAKNGIASVSVKADELNKAISDVKKNGGTTIIIAPEITGTAKKVTVDIPKSSLTSMSSDTKADLKIVTPNGSITIPKDALASVVSQASGNTITIAVESVETKSLTAEQQKIVGDNAVFNISIISGGKPISSFDGKSVTISLPYTLKTGETPKGVTVWYLNDKGVLEKVNSKYDKETGLATFTTTHLSNYVVGYVAESIWINPFTDVKDADWFYDAVRYAVENELLNGTSKTTFSPNTDMTRAMLVTVLYRMESKPAVTGTNSFTDVEDGKWYTDAIIWANANGIVTGYGDGLFGTNDPITREQMAAMLLRFADYKKYDTTGTNDLAVFTDVSSISSWALSAMKWANAEGLIMGREDTILAPAGTATRAEVATILMRFAENMVK